jgi:uncharacterized protein
MIINFKIKNFNSYKEEQTLDFERKSKEQTGNKFVHKQNNLDLLKVVGLVGVNGSGKTSLLKGLDFMKSMVLDSQKHNVDSNITYSPFSTNSKKPIEFEITFISENKKYIYGFSYTNKKILKEFAKVYETQKPIEIFSRDEENLDNNRFEFHDRYKKELKTLSYNVIPQTLMLSRAVQLNSKVLKPLYDFFTNIFIINSLFNVPAIDFVSLKDRKLKEELLNKLSFADFSIKDLELVKGVHKNIELIQIDGKETINPKITNKEITELNLIHTHKNEKLKVNFVAESSGTQKFILIFYNLLRLKKESIILYDEIENSFNIELIEFIINYFSKNKNRSQLLFTTHQSEILNYLRSDQIKIIEKEDSVSKIINLHNIIRNNSKINKNYGDYYREGVLGGFPNVYKEE